jgi:hypothetical protein
MSSLRESLQCEPILSRERLFLRSRRSPDLSLAAERLVSRVEDFCVRQHNWTTSDGVAAQSSIVVREQSFLEIVCMAHVV